MRPTLRCLVVFLAGIPLSLGAVTIHPRLWTVWIAYLGAAITLAGLDALLAMSRRKLKITATLPEQVFIGDTGSATIVLVAGRRGASVEVLAELDDALEPQPASRTTMRAEGAKQPARGQLGIALVPRRRGDHALRAVHARWTGPLGLIEHRVAVPIDRKVGVVPNMGAVRAVALRMFSDHNFMAGLKVEKFLGDGSEFESLASTCPAWTTARSTGSRRRGTASCCARSSAPSATTRSCSRSTAAS